MKRNLKNLFLDIAPYFFVVGLIVLPWLLKSGYVLLTDLTWGPFITLDSASAWFYPSLVLRALAGISSSVIAERLLLVFAVCLPLWGGAVLVTTLGVRERWSRFFLALFALFNPFIYDRFSYGQIGIVLAAAFLLVVLAELIKFYKEGNVRQLGLAGLWSGLAIMFAPHFIFICGLAFLAVVVARLSDGAYSWRNIILGLVLAVTLIFSLNANWLLPNLLGTGSDGQYISEGINSRDLIAFQTAGNGSLDTYTKVIMMSGFWGKDQYRYIDLTKVKELWGRSFIIIMPIIMLGIYFGLKQRKLRNLTISLLVIYIVALVLAVGVKVPATGWISRWLFDHLVIYRSLREPQKLVSLLVGIYLFFLTLGVKTLSEYKIIKDNRLTAGVFLGVVIVMQAPLMFWGFVGQIKPVDYPPAWYQADQLIRREKCSTKILFLPWHQYMRFGFTGGVVSSPVQKFFSCPVISGTNMEWGGIYDNSTDGKGKVIGRWVATKGVESASILDQSEIGYIVLAKEVDWKNYNWLDNLPGWRLIVDNNTLRVYERR